jgi:hypothetical protein
MNAVISDVSGFRRGRTLAAFAAHTMRRGHALERDLASIGEG